MTARLVVAGIVDTVDIPTGRRWGRRNHGDELRASQLDSFDEEVEDDEAQRVGVSTELGEGLNGGESATSAS